MSSCRATVKVSGETLTVDYNVKISDSSTNANQTVSVVITGAFTEYTGMRFIFSVFFAEMGHMIAFSGIATALFLPAFISTNFSVTLPLFLVGGLFLTLPLAPADAMLSDVVVAPLRGRASSMRSARSSTTSCAS